VKRTIKFLASGRATAALLIVISALAAYASLLREDGAQAVIGSFFFESLLVLLFANILLGMAVHFRRDMAGAWMQLIRLGALAILAGAFLGALRGRRGYAQLYEGRQTGELESPDGSTFSPGFSLRLDRFSVEKYPRSGLSIGIASKGDEEFRVYPARIGSWTGPAKTRVLPLRYLPDFKIDGDGNITSRSAEPNNPALEIEVRSGGQTERGWLFARFPHLPPAGLDRALREAAFVFPEPGPEKIKSFKSDVSVLRHGRVETGGEIEVNRPFRFGGYRIYQLDYNPATRQWSGLEFVHDPGLPLVYAGFLIIALGVTLWVCLDEF